MASPGFKEPLGPQLHLETICGRDSAGCPGGRPGDSGPSPSCSPPMGPSRAQNCGSPSRDREPGSSGNPAALPSLAVISECSARGRLGPLSPPGAPAQRGRAPPPLCLPQDPGSATVCPGHSCLIPTSHVTTPHSRALGGLGKRRGPLTPRCFLHHPHKCFRKGILASPWGSPAPNCPGSF